jgi:hypothetical protein
MRTEQVPAGRPEFVVCVRNDDYPVCLVLHKIYAVIPDPRGEEDDLVRIVDESGEDYLFSREYFHPVDVPDALREALLRNRPHDRKRRRSRARTRKARGVRRRPSDAPR